MSLQYGAEYRPGIVVTLTNVTKQAALAILIYTRAFLHIPLHIPALSRSRPVSPRVAARFRGTPGPKVPRSAFGAVPAGKERGRRPRHRATRHLRPCIREALRPACGPSSVPRLGNLPSPRAGGAVGGGRDRLETEARSTRLAR